jgi:hypothetical protein
LSTGLTTLKGDIFGGVTAAAVAVPKEVEHWSLTMLREKLAKFAAIAMGSNVFREILVN